MKGALQKRTLLILFVMAMIILVPLAIGGMDVVLPFLSLEPVFLLSFLVLLCVKWYSIAVRGQMFLAYSGYQIRKRTITPVLWSYEFLSDLFPKNIVAPIVCFALFKKNDIPYATTAALGFFCMVMDTVSILLLVAMGVLAGGAIGDDAIDHRAFLSFLLVVTILLIVLSLFYRKSIGRFLMRIPLYRFVPSSRRDQVARAVVEFSTAISRTDDIPAKAVAAILLLSLANWTARLSFLYLSVKAAGQSIGWIEAMLIQALSGVAGTITFMPGGFPGADITVAALLSGSLGLTDTLAILVLWRIMTFYVNVFVGGAAFVWLGLGVSLRSFLSGTRRSG